MVFAFCAEAGGTKLLNTDRRKIVKENERTRHLPDELVREHYGICQARREAHALIQNTCDFSRSGLAAGSMVGSGCTADNRHLVDRTV